MTDFGDFGESIQPAADEPVDELDPRSLDSQFQPDEISPDNTEAPAIVPPGVDGLPADLPPEEIQPEAVPPELADAPPTPIDVVPADIVPATPPPADIPAETYTVNEGDTLWAIAEREYGDGSLAYRLAELNNIPNPDLIYADQTVTLFPKDVLTGDTPPAAEVPPAPEANPFAQPNAMPTPTVEPGLEAPQVPPSMNPLAPTPAQPVADLDLKEAPQVPPGMNPFDPAPEVDSAAVTPEEELHVTAEGHLGDEEAWSKHWFQQAENGNCVPASVAQIVSEFTGEDLENERALVDLANKHGLFIGGDNRNGVTIDDAAKLLTLEGIPATVEHGDIESLARAINDGRGVMAYVDSGEYWNPAGEAGEDNKLDHCVVVSDIDIARGIVYLSDPGHPDGDAMQVPIEQFEDAWADSENGMVVCDQPPENAADQSGPDAHQAGAPAPTDVAITVNKGPWALLPIVLAVGGAAAVGAFVVKRRRAAGAPGDVTPTDTATEDPPAEKQGAAAATT